jgi:FkbM family methyltransferase
MANPLLALASLAARWLPENLKQSLYKLGPITSLIRSSLNRSAPAGLVKTTISGGLLASRLFELDMQTEKDYWLGTYEPQLQQAIRDWVKPGMMVYDVGANVGYVSLMLASRSAKVTAFEPLPANQQRFRANLAMNADLETELIPKAVSDHAGQADFVVHSSDDMGRLLGTGKPVQPGTNVVRVETISLDDFVFKSGQQKPNLVKIDVEGAEVFVLKGMRALLEEKPILFLELHDKEAAHAAWELLAAAGYSVRAMQLGYPPVRDPQTLKRKSYVVATSLDA